MDLFIIDSSSPFFTKHPHESINWSKTPFDSLEKNGEFHKKTYKSIRILFREYIKKVSAMGYNAISLDDVAHMVNQPFYTDELQEKLRDYGKEFKRLIKIASGSGLKVFATTDIMFFNESIYSFIRKKRIGIRKLLQLYITKLFDEYEDLDGVIFRLGESDGVDVTGNFKSRIVIRSPEYANKLIKSLLPIFEKKNKLFILRTWTTGAYSIGDLLWNERTLRKLLSGIESSNFLLSMKYGNADFFRFLNLSPFFMLDGFKKIIELQTRREYEGHGEFPSFIGGDYLSFYKKIGNRTDLAGIFVWCQTGGWSSFRNFTFTRNSSIWNEINTFVTVKIFRYGLTAKESSRLFFEKHIDSSQKKSFKLFWNFLCYSEIIVKDLYYDPKFAEKEYYFNKIRISPLLHILWDQVTMTDLVVLAYRTFNHKGNLSIKKGRLALLLLKRMEKINSVLNLPYDYEFHYRTFKLLYQCRKLIYNFDEKWQKNMKKLRKSIKDYTRDYPEGYHFYIKFKRGSFPLIMIILRLLIRKTPPYRFIDKLLFNTLTTGLLLTLYGLIRKNFPLVAGKQGMPMTTFFK